MAASVPVIVHDDVEAAIPTSLVEDTAFIGPRAKVRDDLAAWEETVVTTLLLRGDAAALRAAAEALA